MRQEFQDFLNLNLPKSNSFHPYYNDALQSMIKAGGKHFRAMLLLNIVKIFKPELTKKAMRIALAFEFLHTYSLIHDDLPVMDNASFRRNKPTIHKEYNEVLAILVGDALNTQAFLEISKADLPDNIKIRCVEILSENAGTNGMVLGQAIDCHFENQKLNLEELIFMHTHKTAKLIAASLKTGALISGLDDKKCDKIYQMGLKLGLAFQIQDDIVDALSNSKEAGKPTQNDKSKNSFTNLLGIQEAKKFKENLINEIKFELKKIQPEISQIITNLIDKNLY